MHELVSLDASGNLTTQWYDELGNRNNTYLIRGFDPTAKRETDFVLGYFPLTPREFRISRMVRAWIPDVIQSDITDQILSWSTRLALASFNVHPPLTTFDVDSLPVSCEPCLIMGTQVHIALLKQANLGVHDFGYNDMGFSLNINRGAPLLAAADKIGALYTQTLSLVKFQFVSAGVGLGTLPLPVSVGASLSRGMLNVLDIMNQMSR